MGKCAVRPPGRAKCDFKSKTQLLNQRARRDHSVEEGSGVFPTKLTRAGSAQNHPGEVN